MALIEGEVSGIFCSSLDLDSASIWPCLQMGSAVRFVAMHVRAADLVIDKCRMTSIEPLSLFPSDLKVSQWDVPMHDLRTFVEGREGA